MEQCSGKLEFRNTTEQGLAIEDVQERILRFMRLEPAAIYKFIIGTDCQVHPGCTKFISGVVIQRMGKGAWACYRQVLVPRELTSLKEKLSTETALSEEIALFFDEAMRKEMEDVAEMVRRVESVGMVPVIKPDSYVASAYANRFSKKPASYRKIYPGHEVSDASL